MSNLDNITNKILEDAKQEAARMIADAEEQGRQRVEEQMSDARKEGESRILKAKEEVALIRDRILTGAERESRDQVLLAKQQVIERIFAEAKRRLSEMPEEEYDKVVGRVLSGVKEQGFILQIPKGRKIRTEKQIPVEVDPTLESGFRIVTGGVRQNYDFAALVDYLQESLEAEVLRIAVEG